jgi:hypothetical protein
VSHINEKGLIGPFDYFIDVLKTAFFWKKMMFETKKCEWIIARRAALKEGNMDEYKKCVNSSA